MTAAMQQIKSVIAGIFNANEQTKAQKKTGQIFAVFRNNPSPPPPPPPVSHVAQQTTPLPKYKVFVD